MLDVTTTGRIIVAGAAGAGALLAASVPVTMAPRSGREQTVVSAATGIAGLATGALAGLAATRLSTRTGSITGAVLAIAGAGAWLALGGGPGNATSSPIASAGFLGAVAGAGIVAQHAIGSHAGRPAGALLGLIAGAATGGALVAAGHALHAREPDPQSPPASEIPPWALGTPQRALVAGGVGVALVGAALGVSTGVRAGIAAPLGVRIRLGAAAGLGVAAAGWAGWSAVRSALGDHGGDRLHSDAPPLPMTATGGARSSFDHQDLPANVERYLRQGVTAERAATYRSDLPASDRRDAVRAFSPLMPGVSQADQARAAVDELDRLGALDRDVLHVVLPTGGGGINEGLAGIVEAYAGGDAATIGLQYASRPSMLALTAAPDGARLLGSFLDRLEQRLASRPAGDHPRIVLSGYSLGAEALREALADPAIRDRVDRLVDGVLVVGPRSLTSGPGARGLEGATVVDDAEQLGASITKPARGPRIVVVRHVSDPAGNGMLPLAFDDVRNPDLGDNSPHVPFATLLGTGVDMILTGYRDVPTGAPWRGHGYTADLPAAARIAFGFDDVPAATSEHVEARTAERIDGITIGDTQVGG